MLVSQAVLITPLELSASISMANYLVLYLQIVALPCVSCTFQIVDLPGTLLIFYRLFTLISSNIIRLDLRHGTWTLLGTDLSLIVKLGVYRHLRVRSLLELSEAVWQAFMLPSFYNAQDIASISLRAQIA